MRTCRGEAPSCAPRSPGRRLLLEIDLPDVALEAIGRVAWTRRVLTPHERDGDCGVGIEFLGAAADQFSALQLYLEKLNDS